MLMTVTVSTGTKKRSINMSIACYLELKREVEREGKGAPGEPLI